MISGLNIVQPYKVSLFISTIFTNEDTAVSKWQEICPELLREVGEARIPLQPGSSRFHSSKVSNNTHLCGIQASLCPVFHQTIDQDYFLFQTTVLYTWCLPLHIFPSIDLTYLVHPLILDCSKFCHYNPDLIIRYRYRETQLPWFGSSGISVWWACIVERVLKDVGNCLLEKLYL